MLPCATATCWPLVTLAQAVHAVGAQMLLHVPPRDAANTAAVLPLLLPLLLLNNALLLLQHCCNCCHR
jgi:hypothetical protein